MLPCELALVGVDVTIVERASQDLVGSRAGGLHSRTSRCSISVESQTDSSRDRENYSCIILPHTFMFRLRPSTRRSWTHFRPEVTAVAALPRACFPRIRATAICE